MEITDSLLEGTPLPRRRSWLALLLSFLRPGMGQLYAGRTAHAVPFLVAFPVLYALVVFVSLTWPELTFFAVAAMAAIYLPLHLWNLIDAFRMEPPPPPIPWYRHWGTLALVSLALGLTEDQAVQQVRHHWLEPFVSPTASMEPTILPGDRFYVDKRYPRTKPLSRGDLVVFRLPAEPTVRYVKRIAAVAGETAEFPTGPAPVPEGTVFVLGDNRDNSRDSRHFGPIPVGSLEGKPTQVWFSFDGDTSSVRWNRIGRVLR